MKKLFLIMLLLIFSTALADTYPSRAITLIVPYSAGGTTDLTARQFANVLKKQLNVPIIIMNQAGASGSIGAKSVLDARADGYTLLFTADSLGTQRTMGISDMSYNDFKVISPLVNDPKVIVVDKNSKYNTIEELIEDIRQKPKSIKMSYTGPGGSGHVQSLIYEKLDLELALTAYQGGSDCILAVLSGQVDFTNSNLSTVIGFIESGELKLLAVSADKRLEKYPDVPALSEIIENSEEYMQIPYTPLSFLASNKVDDAIVDVLKKATKAALLDEEWVKYCKENELEKLYEKYQNDEEISEFYRTWESRVSYLLFDANYAPNNPESFGIKRLEK